MDQPRRGDDDPVLAPDEWARETAERLAAGHARLDAQALRDDLLDVWRAAVVADEVLDQVAGPAESPRLVGGATPSGHRDCGPSLTHVAAGPGSIALHVQADPQVWTAIPPLPAASGPAASTAAGGEAAPPAGWVAATAAQLLEGIDGPTLHEPFLRTRLTKLWRDGPPPPTGLAGVSYLHRHDAHLARLDITLHPSAGNDGARRRALQPPETSGEFVEIGYHAHRELGPANRVLRFAMPGFLNLSSPHSGLLRLLWPLNARTDLRVSLTARCAGRLLDLLPAVDALIETLEVCTTPESARRLGSLSEPSLTAPRSALRLLSPETQARYQVFAENFVRGLERLPPAVEPYRPVLESASPISEAAIADLRVELARTDGPFTKVPVLLLHTIGADDGEERVFPLTYCTVGGSFGVFAYRSGTLTPPGWFEDLRANPETFVEVGNRKANVRARVLDAERREAIWEEQKARYPGLAEYETRTRPVIPVVMLDRC